MRFIFAAAFIVLAACTPPAAETATTAAPAPQAPAIQLTPTALGGQWSFDRACAHFDLVITNASASYSDFTDPSHVVSYDGPWSITDGDSVVMSLRRIDAQGAPAGEPITYNLEVTQANTTDLVGTFGPAGGEMKPINAKQCAFENHE